ncbi:MAG TPA: cyclic nucleotide-binding domain-containing protein, partial [Rhodocyclaceae bacterium]|nr:cyclic nucleotide-binding domain-containing protein [Rhodocyclaceae bacterium]
GSPAYMSPQQVKEQPLDHRTDIYSLGVVMYQLLTGQLPFQASSNYNMVYQIINTEPTLPSALRPELPPQLDVIVGRAMAKTLEDRYQSWDEFGHDLSTIVRERQLPTTRSEFADTEKFATLRTLTFFADFPDVELWEILRFSRWQRVQPGSKIVHDGERGDFFCVVAEGELKVTKHGKMLNVLSAGDCFGEMAVISSKNQTRGADVTALTDANIITVRSDALHHASEACRMHFYQAFLSVLAERLSMANQRLSGF